MIPILVNVQDYCHYTKPHPLKAHALDRAVVVSPLLLYSDDTSGNRSKKWNKFDCWCFLLAGLPRCENTQIPNIHFISCSNQVLIHLYLVCVILTAHNAAQVSVLDMATPIVKELKRLEEGIVVFDAHLQKEVLLIAPVLAVLGDNPRHSALLNHAGSSSNKYCRMCMVTWRI